MRLTPQLRPAALQKAKQDAEAKGFIFETSHDEIVAKARKEGKLRVISSLEMENLKPVSDAFRKKYPFIDLRAEEIAGTDTYQRMLLEMKAGTASGWDVNYLTTDFYDDYFPYQKKFDVLGMAQQGVLQMPVGDDRSGQSQHRFATPPTPRWWLTTRN